MKLRNRSARHVGTGSFSLRATRPCTADPAFADRPFPIDPLLAKIGRDVSLLMDAHDEAVNNATRGETHFLGTNLSSCFALAKRIQAQRKAATRLLAKAKGGL